MLARLCVWQVTVHAVNIGSPRFRFFEFWTSFVITWVTQFPRVIGLKTIFKPNFVTQVFPTELNDESIKLFSMQGVLAKKRLPNQIVTKRKVVGVADQ